MHATMERGQVGAEHFDYEKRRYYDTVTWLAEVLPGQMRTPFEYTFDGHELYANDGSPLGEIFDDAIEKAKNLPGYEQRRRGIEKEEYQEMIDMMRGDRLNTMVVVSDFPPELMSATRDEGGYNVTRRPTMLRVLTKNPHGTLSMYSQSLDGSNRQALENIYLELGYMPADGELLGQRMHLRLSSAEQKTLVDRLTGIYDRSMSAQFGGQWYAGIRGNQRLNTYDFVCQQQDLIKAYLATTKRFTGGDADYNLAAAMLLRFEKGTSFVATSEYEYFPVAMHAMALAEMNGAGNIARANGITVSGCGASIGPEKDGLSAEDQLAEAGYGDQSQKLPNDKYGTRYFKCPKKSCSYINERPKDKLLPICKKCGTDVSCGDTKETRRAFTEIIAFSFGKQDKLRKEEERRNAWLN